MYVTSSTVMRPIPLGDLSPHCLSRNIPPSHLVPQEGCAADVEHVHPGPCDTVPDVRRVDLKAHDVPPEAAHSQHVRLETGRETAGL